MATVEDLPTQGNSFGDVRLVFADFTLHGWNGVAWITISGSGGGPPPVHPPPNLFIGPVEPDPVTLQANSLYIPTNVDGTPKLIKFWKVYDGLGSGDGGNLFIQDDRPAPLVDALWVPTNPDGTAKYLDQWVVFTGLGSQPDFGNTNLFISVAQPVAPPSGSLHIPLNNDLTPKTIDTWEVYA